MQRVIRTAIASFGMSGLVFHGPLLRVNPGFKVCLILERTKELSKKLFPEAVIVRSWEAILNDPEIELVIVNTPDELHYEMSRQALQAGKHVVVEKPFTRLTGQAQELIGLAKQKGLLLTVFQSRRLDGDFLTVKRLIETNKLGRLIEFESHFDRYRNYIQPDTWKEDEVNDRNGVLFNLGSHMIDQALVLFGMPQAVTAHLSVVREGGKVNDYYDIRLHYRNLFVILKCSYLVREPGPRYSLHGTLGSFYKWGIDPQEEMLKKGHLPNESGWGTEPFSDWGKINTEYAGLHLEGRVETLAGNYNLFYQNIYDVLVNGAALMVKPEESLDGLRILEACLQSNSEKRTIEL